MRISNWSSDVCSSDLRVRRHRFLDAQRLRLLDEPGRARRPVVAGYPGIRGFDRRHENRGRHCRCALPPHPDGSTERRDRKSAVLGKRWAVRVELGGRRLIKKKQETAETRIKPN